MLATALRAGLLNSPQSVMHSGACGELNLLINARMGVGHAGVAIKRSSCRQRHGVAVFSAHGQFFEKKNVVTASDAGGGLVQYRIFSTKYCAAFCLGFSVVWLHGRTHLRRHMATAPPPLLLNAQAATAQCQNSSSGTVTWK